MTRIALIRQQYRPDGGAERFVSRALQALAQHGVELALITRQWLDEGPFKVYPCDPPIRNRISRERDFARQASALCAREHFDIVQSHERIPGCSLYRAGDGVHRRWLDLRRQILFPAARWWQEHSAYHRYVIAAERAMFTDSRLRTVICNSAMVRQEIIDYYGVDSARLEVIYSGVDSELFHPRWQVGRAALREQLGIPQAALLHLFVGSGFERKNLETLMLALARLPTEHQAAIVGRDSHVAAYQRRAHRLGIAHRVHFLGVRRDLPALYGMADTLVLPTLYDPFPNVILEAMASGLPIITSDTCGGAELIADQAGLVAPARDDEMLRLHMMSLYDDDRRRRLGQQGRQLAEKLDYASMTAQLLSLYGRLLQEAA